MEPYYFSFEEAATLFPLVALLVSVPYVIYNYRKYGSISVWRTIVLFSFIFYLQCVYFVVILPLPDPASLANEPDIMPSLIPFYFVYEFFTESSFELFQVGTWIPAFTSGLFLHSLLNCLMLFPFGVYLAYYFKCSWKKVLLFSFLFSLFCEVTQLTALYGLYPKAYRVFDVDDLITNVFGAMVGYFVYTRFLRFLPSRDRIDEKSVQRSVKVGYLRRFTAFAIDYVVTLALWYFVATVGNIDATYAIYFIFVLLCVYTIGVSLITKGTTIGKAVVRIKVSQTEGAWPFALAITVRYLCRNGMLFALAWMEALVSQAPGLELLWAAIYLVIVFLVAADLLYSAIKAKPLWYERLSRTQNVSTLRR